MKGSDGRWYGDGGRGTGYKVAPQQMGRNAHVIRLGAGRTKAIPVGTDPISVAVNHLHLKGAGMPYKQLTTSKESMGANEADQAKLSPHGRRPTGTRAGADCHKARDPLAPSCATHLSGGVP